MLPPDSAACYEALRAHDARFDGVFFVGVSSTGIYCRPVCPAKLPLARNCTFFPHAAAAERAGYRPCLRCRPELAPGNACIDATSVLATRAVSRIEEGALQEKSVAALAEELGVSDRHLRRAVEGAFGVTPIVLAQTQRLLLAKRLLTDTVLPITQVAFASGFASVRRFNAVFRERYRLSPTALRHSAERRTAQETLCCTLAYRPPLAWDALLRFLQGRALGGVESVEAGVYRRTLEMGASRGWLAVTHDPKRLVLNVELSLTLASVLPQVLARVKRLFDLTAEPSVIAASLGALAANEPGLRVPGAISGFELVVRAILGQQVSVKAAATLASRYAAAFGEPIETPFAALTHLTPSPERVAAVSVEELTALGILATRATAIRALTEAVASGAIRLESGGDPTTTLAALKALPGIGEWTAQYIAMRALGWPDAFPHTDLGVMQALEERDPKRVLALADAWRPWRAYAVMHLWNQRT